MSALTPPALAAVLTLLNPPPDPVVARIAADAQARGLATVDPLTGALLHVLTRLTAATKVLEIGTGLGASTLWMATALPASGLLVTLERDQPRAVAARGYLREAGVAGRVTVMIGEASRYLHKIAGPFDLIFQDGDAEQHDALLDKLLRLLKPGGVLVTTAIVSDGGAGPEVAHDSRLATDPRLHTTWLPIGEGLALSLTHAPEAPGAGAPPDGDRA